MSIDQSRTPGIPTRVSRRYFASSCRGNFCAAQDDALAEIIYPSRGEWSEKAEATRLTDDGLQDVGTEAKKALRRVHDLPDTYTFQMLPGYPDNIERPRTC